MYARAPVHADDSKRDEYDTDADEDPQAVRVADLSHEERAQKASEPASQRVFGLEDASSRHARSCRLAYPTRTLNAKNQLHETDSLCLLRKHWLLVSTAVDGKGNSSRKHTTYELHTQITCCCQPRW